MESLNSGYAPPLMTASLSLAAGATRAAAIVANPSSYEIPVKPRSVVDQQDLPCCVSTALGAAMEILNPGWPALAPLFHYYVTRYDNRGADPRGFLFLGNGLDTLTYDGICRKELHPEPYTNAGSATKPKPEAYADAAVRALGLRDLLGRYERPTGPSIVAWIREQLRQDHPVVLGIQLPQGYPTALLNSEWLDPDKPPRSINQHCVLVFGYDDSKAAIHIQDSRGKTAFERGCWWMGYRVVDSTVVHEVYSLTP